MKLRGLLGLALLGAGTLFWGVCSAKSVAGSVDSGLRPTNVELYVLSQSCFQGEVVPCG
jgi:hypothetical protein